MDDAGVSGESVHLSRDTVVETGADGDEAVAFMSGHVAMPRPVHPQHAQGEGRGRVHDANRHQGVGYRNISLLRQGAQLGASLGKHDAAAGIDERHLRFVDDIRRFSQLFLVDDNLFPVAPAGGFFWDDGPHPFSKDVAGEVHQHGTRPEGPGHQKRLPQLAGQVPGVCYQVVVFGNGAGDAGHVRLLEGVDADGVAGYLAGEGDHRDGVHIGGGYSGDQVGGARSGGGEADAHLAGCTGVAVRGMGRGLFVSHQDVADVRFVQQGIVDQEAARAGIAENGIHPLPLEAFEKYLGSALHGVILLSEKDSLLD